jgi:hypothetical protein
MFRKKLVNFFIWGVLLWLFGYILGIVFFFFLPPSLVGWAITPFGIFATVILLVKKIKLTNLSQALLCGLIWISIAIIFDYFFLVKIFKPIDGYYKLDVYLYYFLIFALPSLVGFLKKRKK